MTASRVLKGLLKILVAVAVGLLAALLLLVTCYYSQVLLLYLPPADRVMIYVPDGFEGNVIIAWNIPDGSVAEMKDGVWQYYLQEDGALLLNNERLGSSVEWRFSILKHDGTFEEIPYIVRSDGTETAEIVAYGGSAISRGYQVQGTDWITSFTIASPEDYHAGKWRRGEQPDLLDRYWDRLSYPVEE